VKPAVLGAIVVAAGLAGAAAYVMFGREAPAPEPAVTAAAASAGTAATPAAAGTEGSGKRLVERVPEFQLADREGKMRSLADWQGKSLIVNFWATWCAPCRREIPLLQQIANDHREEGFEVIGIAVDFRDKVLAYADEMKIEYPLLIGEQEALDAAAAFGIESIGFPFTVFTDAQGRIVAAHMGELHAPEAEVILRSVKAVNAGTLTPVQARAEITAALAALAPPAA
jgi:thiol-disulfide isomerase/thioredoxin